jgi:hypothetical protein
MLEIVADNLLASAVKYLIEGEEHEAATVLLMCTIYVEENSDFINGINVRLSGPRTARELLGWESSAMRAPVMEAFESVLPGYMYLKEMFVSGQYLDNLDPDWRQELLEISSGRGVHNQGVEIPNRTTVSWNNLRFRSESERRIAIALDANGALFLPNCLARLSKGDGRLTKEADFLVCNDGRWGVLEVDGPFHPRAAVDHDRDRLFQAHGIKVTERYDWERCYNDALGVVREFLALLALNG